MTEPITDEDLAVLAGHHTERCYKGLIVDGEQLVICDLCYLPWPCPTVRLIARLDAAVARAVPEGWKVHWALAEFSDERDVPVLIPVEDNGG